MQDKLDMVIEKARSIYPLQGLIRCPYFQDNIVLTSDGFNHLQYKNNRMLRNVDEQILKLTLLPKALEVIKKAGTLQEYRKSIEKIGKPGKDGFYKTKNVEYWGFHAIIGKDYLRKIVVILRRVGDGKITFWSVMPHKKFNNQKLYDEGIEDF
ncbi:MAG: hypothetical protein WC662_04665 [Candidatus Paceibacterota bacterium]|jgi:hypothetical protein